MDYLAEEIAQNDPVHNPVRANDIDRIWSIATAFGGNDNIAAGDRNDIVIGGFGDDVINTGGGYNIALGDSGKLTSAEFDATDRSQIVFAVHDFTLCRIETSSDTDFTDGGADTITGSDLNDVIFGGSGSDTIFAGAGDDLVFGDQGMVECENGTPFVPEISLRPVCVDIGGFLEFSATHTTTLAGSGDDLIFGQAGDDLIMPSSSEAAISLANLDGTVNLADSSILQLNAKLNTTGRAGFVFDQYSATDYKWAAIDVLTHQVLIGHRQGNSQVIDAAVSVSTLTAGKDYTLGISLVGSTVSVTLDGQSLVGFAYNAVTSDGRFGVFTKGGM